MEDGEDHGLPSYFWFKKEDGFLQEEGEANLATTACPR